MPALTHWYLPPAGLRHHAGPDHPESPQRLAAIRESLAGRRLIEDVAEADDAALLRVHQPAHLVRIARLRGREAPLALDPDTQGNGDSYAAARLAAGCAVDAVGRVQAEGGLAFCAVRPPGHHAEPGRAMGFCFYNNVAIAAAQALASGRERVAILDFDVHYGNGTSLAFADDPRVLVCQTYQDPFYPFWRSLDRAHIVDVALPHGSDGTAMRHAVQTHWAPALEAHAPQLILVSAGFDAHRLDPLAGLQWETDDYAWLGRWIGHQAQRHCEGGCVATLEGGYEPEALAASVLAFCEGFHEANEDSDVDPRV
ncbi:histone deacetylase family protein [Algiphilus sp.]|uniref:histone deacetylase family protein n=1 Tax=Algiphilus sp. TaxID=1872431 RepID=UPI0032EB686A